MTPNQRDDTREGEVGERELAFLQGLEAGSADGRPSGLAGLRLGRDTLAAHLDPGAPAPAWWSESGGLDLSGAALSNADLSAADLSGADLSRAVLRGARARSTDFTGARLEGADFAEADLSGARLSGLIGGQVNFADAMLEDASFAGASMRFARLSRAFVDSGDFTGADLWGADLEGADADGTLFRNARADDANLSDANLTFADFQGASLKRARLKGSRLRGANFNGARLDAADLSRADLTEANLVQLNLATCGLTHVRLAGAWLSGTRLRVAQLGGAVGEEVAGDFEAAQASYLALEQNLRSIGSRDEASWAYKRRRLMGRYGAGAAARAAWSARDVRRFVRQGYRWSADRFVEWLCDYGESLSRILRAFVVVILLFAVLYGATGGLVSDGGDHLPSRDPVELLSYSALNTMTSNPPEIGLKPVGSFTNLLVGLQGATGIVLMGLFGFVLGNRLRR